MIFFNPWIYDIINDEMPNLYTRDSHEDKKLLYIIIYWLVLSLILLIGGIWITPYIVSFFIDNNIINLFPFALLIVLAFYVIIIYFGCKKILK